VDLERMHRAAGGAVRFLLVYIREAHALDEWVAESNTKEGVAVAQPDSVGGRCDAAQTMCARLDVTIPAVSDTLDDRVARLYGAWPDRLYVVDERGVVVHQGAVGPFGFRTSDVRNLLGARWGLTLPPTAYEPPPRP
jgi:type I thyroxine 5'-deiodinase